MAQQQASFVTINITGIKDKTAINAANIYEKKITGMLTQNFIMGLSNDDDFVMGPYLPNIGYTLYCFDINNQFEPLTITATPIVKGGKKGNYYGCISELKRTDEIMYSFASTINDNANPPKNVQSFCANLIAANQKVLQSSGFSGIMANSIMNVNINEYLKNLRGLYNNMQSTPMPPIFKILESFQRGE